MKAAARFVAAGALNTASTYALYCVLVSWLDPQVAYAIVFALGIGLAYALNARFVFDAPTSVAGAAGYPLVYLATYAVNALLLAVLSRPVGPRVALLIALAISTPLSFVLNRWALAGSDARRARLAATAGALAPIALTGLAYARGFGGFFHGDDFANLAQAFAWDEQGVFWSGLAGTFAHGNAAAGAFYRPLQLASLYLNYAVAGADYASWFAVNLALHLANVALVGALALRMTRDGGAAARIAALVAAAWFGLFAPLAEGVYWVCARADAIVTLLTLLATLLWLGGRAIAAPVLLAAALLCKESAAVLPLQLGLLWLAAPAATSRAQKRALGACVAVVAAFFAFRALLFGNAWQVYGAPGAAAPSPLAQLGAAIASAPAWWRALNAGAAGWATAALALAALAFALGFVASPSPARRRALALACASGGLLLATALNLGALDPSGEGGRLTYTPAAWTALALGVALAASRAGAALLALATLAGLAPLVAQLDRARAAQDEVRSVVAAIPGWTARHDGFSLLLVPERLGAVVTMRNAQGGAALPPVQRQPLLDRALPTLGPETSARWEQLHNGLLSRLRALSPRHADAPTLLRLLEPAPAAWPEHVACWSRAERRFVELAQPRTSDARAWRDDLAVAIAGVCDGVDVR